MSPCFQTESAKLLSHSMVRALLRELQSKLDALANEGREDHIDLRRLPLPPGVLDALKAWLGHGETQASIRSLAISDIQETGLAGVWWVRHAKLGGDVMDEHLEITHCPVLLKSSDEEVSRAAEALRSGIATIDRRSESDLSPSADAR